MPDQTDDLQATMEAIHTDAERVQDIEEEKADLDPADPRLATKSDQVLQVADELRDKAMAERELVDEGQASN